MIPVPTASGGVADIVFLGISATDLLAAIVPAALGALLVFAAARVRSHVEARRLQRRYPVAGRFITKYEDSVGPTRTTMKAWAVLRQKGRELTGDTAELATGRTWTFDGRVEPGFVCGLYRALDPHDKGMGTFFLEIDAAGDMEGVWGGYDSENREVNGGPYWFRRAAEVDVRHAVIADAPQVCALLGEALGERYVDVETVRAAIAATDESTCLLATGRNGLIVGAATFYLVDRVSFARFLPVGHEDLAGRLPVFRFNESVGLLRSIAVRPAQRGRGVATKLIQAGVAWCHARSATAMLAVAWAPPAGCPLAGVLAALRFEQGETIASYWAADVEAKNYGCPVCGRACTCGAIVFSRSLDGA